MAIEYCKINGKHVFTTVYEADAFVPLARLVWLEDKLTQAANGENTPKIDIEKLDQLKQVALQNIGELKGLDEEQTIPPVANDEPPKHSKHQTYWYQNDHLGTPRELTSNTGNIEWEAVYQAWGNTVTVEWQEVAQAQEFNPIQLNVVEQSYLLQPHRFQGQIYDVETGLHYNRFRYYDPDVGRFISHDPIGLMGGDNNFQYAPNPVGWVDLVGLKGMPVGGWNYHNMPKIADFELHHVLPKSLFEGAKPHAIFKLADFDVHNPKNLIYLPKDRANHSTRSVHCGFDRYHAKYNKDWRTNLDELVEFGKHNKWTKSDYNNAINELVKQTRQDLRNGAIQLSKKG